MKAVLDAFSQELLYHFLDFALEIKVINLYGEDSSEVEVSRRKHELKFAFVLP